MVRGLHVLYLSVLSTNRGRLSPPVGNVSGGSMGQQHRDNGSCHKKLNRSTSNTACLSLRRRGSWTYSSPATVAREHTMPGLYIHALYCLYLIYPLGKLSLIPTVAPASGVV